MEREGPRALFKGLGPNLVGVAPSRAIYFCAYSQSKEFLNRSAVLPPNSAAVHVCSASCAGECQVTPSRPLPPQSARPARQPTRYRPAVAGPARSPSPLLSRTGPNPAEPLPTPCVCWAAPAATMPRPGDTALIVDAQIGDLRVVLDTCWAALPVPTPQM